MDYTTKFKGTITIHPPLSPEQTARLQEFNRATHHPNKPPWAVPSSECQWTVNDAGTELYWDERESFSHYSKWLRYLIKIFYAPWGRTLNGKIEWKGEDYADKGLIEVKNNKIRKRRR